MGRIHILLVFVCDLTIIVVSHKMCKYCTFTLKYTLEWIHVLISMFVYACAYSCVRVFVVCPMICISE